MASPRAPTRTLLSALLCLAACTELKPADVLPDAGAQKAEPDACTLAHPPEPATSASSEGAQTDHVFVLSRSEIGASQDRDGTRTYRRLGYDLDDACTGPGEESRCVRSVRSDSEVQEDGSDGRDHALNALLWIASRLPLANKEQLSFDIAGDANVGRASIAIVVHGYNGEPDDDRVEVDVLSVSMWPNVEGGPRPSWQGDDPWHTTPPWLVRAEDGTLSYERPRFRDAHAYVRDHVFVARFPSLLAGFAFVPGGTWRDVVISGKLTNEDDRWSIEEGVFAGAWPLASLLQFAALNFWLCRGLSDEEVSTFCNSADLNLTGDASAACDALSFAYGFSARTAALGDPMDVTPREPDPCPVRSCGPQRQ